MQNVTSSPSGSELRSLRGEAADCWSSLRWSRYLWLIHTSKNLKIFIWTSKTFSISVMGTLPHTLHHHQLHRIHWSAAPSSVWQQKQRNKWGQKLVWPLFSSKTNSTTWKWAFVMRIHTIQSKWMILIYIFGGRGGTGKLQMCFRKVRASYEAFSAWFQLPRKNQY